MTKSDLESPEEYLFDTWLVELPLEPVYEESLQKIYESLINAANGHQDNSKVGQVATRFRINENQDMFRRIGEKWLKIPKIKARDNVLREIHDDHGHFGQEASWQRLYSHYWWPKAYEEVKDYVKSCKQCQIHAYLPNKLPNDGTVLVQKLFERFAVDYIGPFPVSDSKNKYIIMAVEYYSGWPIAKAVKVADHYSAKIVTEHTASCAV